jgi:hypothetical protein
VTSRSNWAKDNSTLRVRRPIEVMRQLSMSATAQQVWNTPSLLVSDTIVKLIEDREVSRVSKIWSHLSALEHQRSGTLSLDWSPQVGSPSGVSQSTRTYPVAPDVRSSISPKSCSSGMVRICPVGYGRGCHFGILCAGEEEELLNLVRRRYQRGCRHNARARRTNRVGKLATQRTAKCSE